MSKEVRPPRAPIVGVSKDTEYIVKALDDLTFELAKNRKFKSDNLPEEISREENKLRSEIDCFNKAITSINESTSELSTEMSELTNAIKESSKTSSRLTWMIIALSVIMTASAVCNTWASISSKEKNVDQNPSLRTDNVN